MPSWIRNNAETGAQLGVFQVHPDYSIPAASTCSPSFGLGSRPMNLKIRIYPGEDGYLIAECPALPGCATQGKSRDEVLANIREAINGWLGVQAENAPAATVPGVEEVEVQV